MNSSLWSADIVTHIKIVAISLLAAIVVATVGLSARIADRESASVRIHADAPMVVKAGKPMNFSTNDRSTVR